MSVLGAWWARADENAGVSRRFDADAADACAYAVREISVEWAALQTQIDALVATSARLSRFLLDDRSMLPALRDDTAHFAAHHLTAGTQECHHCVLVSELVREYDLALIALSSRGLANATRAEYFFRRDRCLGKRRDAVYARRLYATFTAVPLLKDFYEHSAEINNGIHAVRALLLRGPATGENTEQLFGELCDALRAMISHVDALFAASDTRRLSPDETESPGASAPEEAAGATGASSRSL